MSYDTKAPKNRAEPLQSGVALSTLVFVEEDEQQQTNDAEITSSHAAVDQPPSTSTANDAD